MLTLKQKLAKNVINSLGWKTKRHIVVIESDDWGSIRMPSREVYEKLLSKGIPVDKYYFDKYDSLETSEDLSSLFEVLSGSRDINSNPAVITPLTIVANPLFEEIERNNKTKYAYEKVTDTYKRYAKASESYNLFKQGIAEGVFYPQFHGREHIHVKRWMEANRTESFKENLAFHERCIIRANIDSDVNSYKLRYTPAFDFDSHVEICELQNIVTSGLSLFQELYGYKSFSFCPPCSIMSFDLNKTLANNGVMGLQAGQQFIPLGGGKIKKKDLIWGATNEFGQVYWRRNCTFEPAKNQNIDWVDRCLAEINIAFRWGKPAVINSHRVNYIGSIFQENRDQTLKKLSQLFREIQKRWPDVEFMNSEQLGKLLFNTL